MVNDPLPSNWAKTNSTRHPSSHHWVYYFFILIFRSLPSKVWYIFKSTSFSRTLSTLNPEKEPAIVVCYLNRSKHDFHECFLNPVSRFEQNGNVPSHDGFISFCALFESHMSTQSCVIINPQNHYPGWCFVWTTVTEQSMNTEQSIIIILLQMCWWDVTSPPSRSQLNQLPGLSRYLPSSAGTSFGVLPILNASHSLLSASRIAIICIVKAETKSNEINCMLTRLNQTSFNTTASIHWWIVDGGKYSSHDVFSPSLTCDERGAVSRFSRV